MIRGLHAALTAVWHSGVGRPYLGNQEDKTSRLQQLPWNNAAQHTRQVPVLAHLLLTRICTHLLMHQSPEQSGFTSVS